MTSQLGFAVSSNENQVVETSDGGHIWYTRLAPSGTIFTDISAPSVHVIYAIGISAGGPCLYRSNNGGSTWSLLFEGVHSPSALATPYEAYLKAMGFNISPLPQFKANGSVHFTSPTTGWLSLFSGGYLSQMVLHTTDGGSTWSYAWGNGGCAMSCNALGGGLYPASFYGAKHVWRFDGAFIDVSTNAGQTWNRSQALRFSMPPSQAVTSLHMVTAVDGWLTASAGIYNTLDGGLVWKHQWPSFPTSAARISMRSSKMGWMVSQTLPQMLWTTHNGGRTWAESSHIFQPINSLNLWGRNQGMVVSLPGPSALTANGGTQWKMIQWPTSFATGLTQVLAVQFLNPDVGWAINARDQLLSTTHGPHHWHVAHQFKPGLVAIDFLSPQDGWALSGHKIPKVPPKQWYESILMTTDAGTLWSSVGRIPLADNPTALSFTSMQQGWITTPHGLLETTNGGHTWSMVALPHIHPASLDAVTPRTIYITTLKGRLLVSQNQGATWNTLIP